MNNFCSSIWQEESTPIDQQKCIDCGLYEHGSRMVWGEGNPAASIIVILDNPGERETKTGEAYVCGTRQTLQQTAHEVGLSENDLYITYILKRRPKRAYDKDVVRQICIGHLEQQLQNKQPNFILCLGNVAVQSFFRNADVDVKSLRGTIHDVRGYQTAVAYHPLAIRRRPNLRPLCIEDWKHIAEHYRR